MNKRALWITVGAVAAAVVGAGAALAAGVAGSEEPLTGTTLQRATDAALRHTGGGTVTETEVGDDGAAYSVEIRRPDGSQVEVNLDEAFNVTGSEADLDAPNETPDGN